MTRLTYLVEFIGGPLAFQKKELDEATLYRGEYLTPIMEDSPASVYRDKRWQWQHAVTGVYEVWPTGERKALARWRGVRVDHLPAAQS